MKQTPRRPALKYPGAKWKMGKWINEQLPPGRIFVDLFGGSAAVLLHASNNYEIEVYNDLNSDLVNFFEVLRNSHDELSRRIKYTPYSKEVYEQALDMKSNDSVDRAWALFVSSWMSVGGLSCHRSGFRTTTDYNIAKSFANNDHLESVAERFRKVIVENDTWERVIKRYDTNETVFYIDPPYYSDRRQLYNEDMREMGQHRHLIDILNRLEGKAVLSGYESDLYKNGLSHWRTLAKKQRTTGNSRRNELLWMNFDEIPKLAEQATLI